MSLVKFQMGKAGLTDQFIGALRIAFAKHKIAKIMLLKTASRDKGEVKRMAEEICAKLADSEFRYDYKLIGFTLTVRRFKKHAKKPEILVPKKPKSFEDEQGL